MLEFDLREISIQENTQGEPAMNQPKTPANNPLRMSHPTRTPTPAAPAVPWNDPSQRQPLIMLGGMVFLLVLAYWDMFALTSAAWSEGLYSHGWIVPLFALGLMWMRWEPIGPVPASERWIGLGLLAGGLAMRLIAAEWGMNPVDRISFLPAIFGVFMLVGGMNIIRWAGPALGFLVFMFPLPTRLEQTVLIKLQTLASICSTWCCRPWVCRPFARATSFSISGMDTPLTVADACSGLRMLTIFCALAVAMVFLIERPWWDKFIILLSAIPIALVVNIVRITVTGLMYMWWPKSNFVQHLSHDWAGWFMMPLALGLLWLELQILERLTIPVEASQLKPIGACAEWRFRCADELEEVESPVEPWQIRHVSTGAWPFPDERRGEMATNVEKMQPLSGLATPGAMLKPLGRLWLARRGRYPGSRLACDLRQPGLLRYLSGRTPA